MSDPEPDAASAARIRIVVVNYNGGAMTLACLDRLEELDWPRDRIELVVVDNASEDGVVDALLARPSIRVIRSEENLGFAGGVNLALGDLDGVDYVALINNDAIPDRSWLRPLVEVLEGDASVGAACPKILLQDRFVKVMLRTSTFRPGEHDARELGVMVSDVRVNGRDVTDHTRFVSGFWGPETSNGGPFQWSAADAEFWVPVRAGETAIEVRLRANEPREVTMVVGEEPVAVVADAGGTDVALRVDDAFDVINNVGCRLVAGGWAGDRGFLEVDRGQYEEVEEVFGWCGAAVLLRRAYLDDVGAFDDHLFLYYEDIDLGWRGRLRGWRYVYVPESVVRHIHSATSGEGSALFTHYVDRNRLLVFLRNAPAKDAGDALARAVLEASRIAWRDVLRPTLRSQPRHPLRAKQKLRSLGGVARSGIWALRERQKASRSLRVSRRSVASWAARP